MPGGRERTGSTARSTRARTKATGKSADAGKLAERVGTSDESILQTIMEHTQAQIAYLDADFNLVTVNSAYERDSGKTAAELIGRNHFEFFPDDENEAIFERVRDTGEPVEFHAKPFMFRNQPERGITYWDWRLSPVRSREGPVEGLVLSLSEVTDQVNARREIDSILSELELSNRDLKALEEMTTGVASSIDFGQVLRTMLESLSAYAKADGAGVILMEEGLMHLRSAIGEGVIIYPRETIVSSESYVGQVLASKRVIHVLDIHSDNRIKSPELLGSRLTSMSGVPLVIDEDAFGVLFLGWIAKHHLGERESKVLRIAAGRYSMAIRNAQLYESAREAERLNAAVNEIDLAIRSDAGFDELMGDVCERTARTLQVDRVGLYRLEDEDIVQMYGYGLPREAIGQRFTRGLAQITFECMETGRAVCVNDVETDPRVNRAAHEGTPLKAMIIAPLRLHGHPIGALVAANIRTGPPFPPQAVGFLGKVASSVSLAIENARLFDAERRERYVLQTILDNSPAAIVIVGGKDYRVRWSNAAFRVFLDPSMAEEDISAMPLEEHMPNFKASGMDMALKNARMTGKPVANRELEKSVGGVTTFWRYSVFPLSLTSEVGQDQMVVVVDITEQALARRKIEKLASQAESERIRLRTILDNLPLGVVIVDDKGRFVEPNRRVDQIWAGHPQVDTMEDYRKFRAWWADTGLLVQPEEWAMSQAASGGRVIVGQVFDILRFDGTRGTIMTSAAPLKNAKGEPFGAVAVMQDITRQRQLEHDALESKALSEFYVDLLCNDIGHLNKAILENLKAIGEAKGEEAKLERRIGSTLEVAEESLKLIDIVKKIQLVESHQLKLGLVDLGLTLGEVVNDMGEKHPDELRIVFEPVPWHTTTATELLGDAFRYLIEDTLDTASGKKNLEVTVVEAYENNKQFHKVVFEDDANDKAGRTRMKTFSLPRRGVGGDAIADLRLYLVRIIAEACHGRVWLESRNRGDWSKGRRFVMMLPSAVVRQDHIDSQEEKRPGEPE